MSTITETGDAVGPAAVTPEGGGDSERGSDRRGSRRRLRLRLLGWLAIASAVGAVVAIGGEAVDRGDSASAALGPGIVTVEVGIDHSTFDLSDLRVYEGTIVRFVVRNNDPIDHELVVGSADVHRSHREGSDQRHPPIPGEVSVSAGATALTYYEFDTAGTVAYACHLPGHEAFGMRGEIEVISNQRL